MVADILLSVLLSILTIYMSYLGVHLTLHPADTPKLKRSYKLRFLIVSVAVIGIVIAQGIRNGLSQKESAKHIASLESDVAETRKQVQFARDDAKKQGAAAKE